MVTTLNTIKHYWYLTLNIIFNVVPSLGLGIRGTQVKSSIQDIVDEVVPIKKSPPMGLRADSFECDVTRLI